MRNSSRCASREVPSHSMRHVDKLWGSEHWLMPDGGKDRGYCAKYLILRGGRSGSLHYHPVKDETMLVVAGAVYLDTLPPVTGGTSAPEYDADNAMYVYTEPDGVRTEPAPMVTYRKARGAVWRLPPGTPHRLRALSEEAIILEISTPHDDDDVVRLVDSK